jgi:hypothetical protein
MKRWVLSFVMICSLVVVASADAWPWQKKTAAEPAAKTEAPAPAEVKTAAPEAQAPAAPAAVEAPAKAEPAVAAPTPAPQPSGPAIEKQRALRAKKRTEVNNNQWEIDMMALDGKGAKQKDFLIFKDNKFSSENFAKSGFGPSNYTLSIQDDGSVVVETMQSAEKEGILFWRVELDAQLIVCKGILSRQLGENKTEDYSFLSVGKKPVMNTPPPVEAPKVAAPAEAGK